MGVPPNGWFIVENPIKNGWFRGTPISGNFHIVALYSPQNLEVHDSTAVFWRVVREKGPHSIHRFVLIFPTLKPPFLLEIAARSDKPWCFFCGIPINHLIQQARPPSSQLFLRHFSIILHHFPRASSGFPRFSTFPGLDCRGLGLLMRLLR